MHIRLVDNNAEHCLGTHGLGVSKLVQRQLVIYPFFAFGPCKTESLSQMGLSNSKGHKTRKGSGIFGYRVVGEIAFCFGTQFLTPDRLSASMNQLNFGRNVTLTPRTRFTPKSEQEVIAILDENKGRRIRCIGRLHSWSKAVQCDDVLLDMRNLSDVHLVDAGEKTVVRVGGGCQIKQLLAELALQNWTLPSVGFISEQTVAGAISTGTHGSGRHSLSHYVVSVRVARYDRQSGKATIEEITSGDDLKAARCSVGCVGVILSVTMECRPTYSVEEQFRGYENLEQVLEAEKEFPLQQFYLVPWRWSYMGQHRRVVEAPNSRASWLYQWYRFVVLDIAMQLTIFMAIHVIRLDACVRALFRWVLPNSVIRNCPVVDDSALQLVMERELFRHVETELFVQRDQLDAALQFLRHSLCFAGVGKSENDEAFHAQLEELNCVEEFNQLSGTYCHHYPICVRKVLPDDTLISMASRQVSARDTGIADATDDPSDLPWYAITLTNYHRGSSRKPFEDVASFLAQSMAQLFGARPHWGKLCPLSRTELQTLYPAMDRFREVCAEADPDGVFRNDWTQSVFQKESS